MEELSRDVLEVLDFLPEGPARGRGGCARSRARHDALVRDLVNEGLQVVFGLERGRLASDLVGMPPGRRSGPPGAAEAAVHAPLVRRVGALVKGVPDALAVHADAALGRLLGPGHSALAPTHTTKGQASVMLRGGDLWPCGPADTSLLKGDLLTFSLTGILASCVGPEKGLKGRVLSL